MLMSVHGGLGTSLETTHIWCHRLEKVECVCVAWVCMSACAIASKHLAGLAREQDKRFESHVLEQLKGWVRSWRVGLRNGTGGTWRSRPTPVESMRSEVWLRPEVAIIYGEACLYVFVH